MQMRLLKMPRSKLPSIIIDSREQLPWSFPEEFTVKKDSLPTGDYSLDGMTDLITIERKSLQDMVSGASSPKQVLQKLDESRDKSFKVAK